MFEERRGEMSIVEETMAAIEQENLWSAFLVEWDAHRDSSD
jgi:hypothetical protein